MLPRVHRVTRGGRVYRFHRVTRAALPRDVPEDHPDFIAAWAAEEAKRPSAGPRPVPGTIAATIAAWRASERFLELSAGYRRVMIRHGEAVCTAYGAAPMADLRDRHIRADLARLRPHAANARLKLWRLVCGFAEAHGLSRVCATAGIGKVPTPKPAKHAPWDAAEVAAYRARWPIGTVQRLAFELLHWSAARTNDAVRIGRANLAADGILTFRQSKTGNPAHVPWTCALPTWAEAWHDDRALLHACLAATAGFTFLEAHGRVRSPKGLSNLISASARAAGITGKSAHGLRATRLTMIAESGGSAHAIMAWGGHVSLSEAEQYTRNTDRRKVLRGAEQMPNAVNQPSKPVNRAK